VDGELCVGLFASRDIQPDEELTYDYKFKTFGDAMQACLCGSTNCRGYITKASEGLRLQQEREERERELASSGKRKKAVSKPKIHSYFSRKSLLSQPSKRIKFTHREGAFWDLCDKRARFDPKFILKNRLFILYSRLFLYRNVIYFTTKQKMAKNMKLLTKSRRLAITEAVKPQPKRLQSIEAIVDQLVQKAESAASTAAAVTDNECTTAAVDQPTPVDQL